MNLIRKTARAWSVFTLAQKNDALHGESVMGRGAASLPNSRKILLAPNTFAYLHPDRSIKKGWQSSSRIGDIIAPAIGSTMLEVHRHGRPVLQANICGDDMVLYRYFPGAWEQDLDLGPAGDTVSWDPEIFCDPNDAAFVAWLAVNPQPMPVAA